MTRFASALIFFFLCPTTVNAFQFDSWNSGISVREAMVIAQDKDIPILKEGLVSINKHFDPNVMKYVDTANQFYYQADLLGEHARLNLTFTPASKFLATINIRWSAPFKDRFFQTKVLQLLTSKYGNKPKHARQIFYETLLTAVTNSNDAEPAGDNGHGIVYLLRFPLATAHGRAMILTAWIILHGEDFPRLVTCYIL